jgi:hypothetical protein
MLLEGDTDAQLSGGTFVDCAARHSQMRRDGLWRAAGRLIVGSGVRDVQLAGIA